MGADMGKARSANSGPRRFASAGFGPLHFIHLREHPEGVLLCLQHARTALSRTLCVNHAGDLARHSVDSYVPKALRPEDWEPIASFTRALARLAPQGRPPRNRGHADLVAGHLMGPP